MSNEDLHQQETAYSNAGDFISGVLSGMHAMAPPHPPPQPLYHPMAFPPPPTFLPTPDMMPQFPPPLQPNEKKVFLNVNVEPFVPASASSVPAPTTAAVPTAEPKTMYIERRTKDYDRMDAVKKSVTYRSSYEKMTREVAYFAKILSVVQEDFAETEEDISEKVLREKRIAMKEHLEGLKAKIDAFVSVNLEGEARKRPRRPPPEEPEEEVEYVHPPDKKPDTTRPGRRINRCVDCEAVVEPYDGKTLEEAFIEHALAVHPTPPKEKDETKLEKEKKKIDAAFKKHCHVNGITLEETDSELIATCGACSVILGGVDAIWAHTATPDHDGLLAVYNAKEQRVIIEKNPDVFGPGKPFELTDAQIDIHRMFVDPSQKIVYCGACRKHLPFTFNHIQVHVGSAKHASQLPSDENASPVKGERRKSIPVPKGVKDAKSHAAVIGKMLAPVEDRFACLVCDGEILADDKEVEEHIKTPRHVSGTKMALDAYKTGNRFQKKSRKVKIGLHRKGDGRYWCPACRVTIADATSVFDHQKLAGHDIDCVFGVWFSEGEQYYCIPCNVIFVGRENAIVHVELHVDSEKELLELEQPQRNQRNNRTNFNNDRITPFEKTDWRSGAGRLDRGLLESNSVMGVNGDFTCMMCNMMLDETEAMQHLETAAHKKKMGAVPY